jgi:hypothetical protein
VSLLVLSACAASTEGPTPKLTGTVNLLERFTNPARVCNAQGGERGWRITLLGERFAPLAEDVLTGEPTVGLPEVTLKGPVTLKLARDHVFYRDSEQLFLDIPTRDTTPAADLPEGSYAMEVKNPGGGSHELADMLVLVEPPQVTRVTAPAGFTPDGLSPIVVEGTGFRTDTFPAMKLLRTGAEEVELFALTVDSPTRVTTELPPGTPAGTYDFVISSPEGCALTLPQALTVSYP